MKQTGVMVTEEWLKENMETLYDTLSMMADELYEIYIVVKQFGDKWKMLTFINDDVDPIFFDNVESYPKEEIDNLMSLVTF